jgi:hypothetical protein
MTVPYPQLQIEFAAALAEFRAKYLQGALNATVLTLTVPDIDRELAVHVPAHSLTTLAGHGLRGEIVSPVPVILTANPRLLAYYRLLYGYSQKEFHTAATGLGRFSAMESRGVPRSCRNGFLETAPPTDWPEAKSLHRGHRPARFTQPPADSRPPRLPADKRSPDPPRSFAATDRCVFPAYGS